MRIVEVDAPNVDSAKLLALSQFLISRAQDESASKTISTDAFLNLAKGMNISLTDDQLVKLSQQQPLNNVIAAVNGNEVIFKGSDVPSEPMSVDKARATVDKMAKRAASKGL